MYQIPNLISAAREGQEECVSKWLNSVTNDRNTINEAFLQAVTNGRYECVKLLVDAGADVNGCEDGYPALITAACYKSERIVELLIEAGANVNMQLGNGTTALHKAAIRGLDKSVQLLIEAGADINVRGPDGKTAFFHAAYEGRDACLKLLTEAGADVNAKEEPDDSVLAICARKGHWRCVEILVKANVDVNEQIFGGDTALMEAARNGDEEIVEILIQAGADVNLENSTGRTALFDAARDHVYCLKLLLEAGADVNIADCWACTALLAAVMEDSVPCVKTLLKANIPINIALNSGHNVLQFYGANYTWRDKELCRLLFIAGERIDKNTVTRSGRHSRQTTKPRLGIDEFFTDELNNSVSLYGTCRDVIRKHLIHVNPYQNLFVRVPQLPLPSVVQEYLLYNVTLEIEKEDTSG